ncbi:MAG: hypothetical protein KGO94_13710, partial [Alphaproteobacteria bacterium]|nr:hypothetical protein [Alphaproteobacteria bacterium]
IAVSYKKPESEFVILPVGMAENLCAKHIQYWKSIKKKDGGKHDAFPIFLSFSSSPKAHAGHHKFIRDHILKFRNRWDILDLSPEKLRDPRGWKVS